MDKKSIWHQNVSTNARAKTIVLIVLSIIFIGLAILVWANQTGRISLWADTLSKSYSNNSLNIAHTCINGQQKDVLSVSSGIGFASCKCTYYVYLNSAWATISSCTDLLRDTKCTYGPMAPHGRNFKVKCNCTGAKEFGPVRVDQCSGTTPTTTTPTTTTPTTTTPTTSGSLQINTGCTRSVPIKQTDTLTYTGSGYNSYSFKVYVNGAWANISPTDQNCNTAYGGTCPNCYMQKSTTCSFGPHDPHGWNYRVIGHTSGTSNNNPLLGEKRVTACSEVAPTTTTPTTTTPTWTPPPDEKLSFQLYAPYCSTGTKQINPIDWNFGYYNGYNGISNLTTPVEWFVKSSLTNGSYVSLGEKTLKSGEDIIKFEYESLDNVYYYGVTKSNPVLYFKEQEVPNKKCGETTPTPIPTYTTAEPTPTSTPTTSPTPTPTVTPSTIESPTNVYATVQNSTEMKLSWNPSVTDGVVYYNIYNASTNSLIKSVTSSVNEISITGLKCNTEYKYYVTAGIESNESSPSNTAIATTSTCGTGEDISNKKPENISLNYQGGGLATLSWDNVDGATGYDIYNCNGDYLVSTSQNSYSFTGNNCGQTLCYYVIAHNDSSQSQKSDEASVNTEDCPRGDDTPSRPTVGTLISTGASLWFNILIALLLILGVGYFMFRNRIHGE